MKGTDIELPGIVLRGRPEVLPGQFKRRANRAGPTVFVAPEPSNEMTG